MITQLRLHYTTTTTITALHNTTSSSCGEVITATIATTPKTQLQPPFGQSVDSLCHPCITTTNLSYRFPFFCETSATALCGTIGKPILDHFRSSPRLKLCTESLKSLWSLGFSAAGCGAICGEKEHGIPPKGPPNEQGPH